MFNRKLKSFCFAVLNYLKRLVLFRLIPLGIIILIVYGLFLWQESRNEEIDLVAAAANLAEVEASFLGLTGQEFATISNGYVSVTVKSENLAMSITNEQTGFVWTHEIYDDNMNQVWQDFALAGIIIDTHFNSQFNRQFSFRGNAVVNQVSETKIVADVFFDEAGILFQVEYSISGDTVSVSVLWDSIVEANRQFELQTITLYPFLGASRGVQDGFIFMPDGIGAIIDLSYETRARSPFSAIVFGDDLGFYGNAVNARVSDLRPPHTVRVPVFGIGYDDLGGNALMSFISSGYEHLEIVGYSAGVTTPYNWAGATFRYRDVHLMALLATGAQMNQEIPNKIDVVINFTVLSGENARYDGMARRLQEKLINEGILTPLDSPHGDMFATIFIADNENALIGRHTIEVTTPEQTLDIAEALSYLSPNGIRMEVFGFQDGGLTGESPRLRGFVGSDSRWRNLINSFSGNDYLFFRREYTRVFNGAGGVRSWHLAQNISEEVMGMHNDQMRSIPLQSMGAPNYEYFRFLNPTASWNVFERDLNRFRRMGIENISFVNMGQQLTSIHGRHRHTRGEMISFYRELLEHGQDNGLTYALHNPNMYLWDKTNIITSMPVTTSGFTILSYSVPFMPILLSGHVETFATNANLQPDMQTHRLRLVEFGLRPSYLLTYESPIVLVEAESNWIHSSQFSIWENRIEENAEFMQDFINATIGARFTHHNRLSPGVYESLYSNGVRIIVNHTNNNFTTSDGYVVPSRNYIVR